MTQSVRKKWRTLVSRRRTRTRLIHVGLVLVNAVLLSLVGAIIALNPSHSAADVQPPAATASDVSQATQPIDTLASVNIAVTVAEMTHMSETLAVVNESQSAAIQQSIASTNDTVINKPQAVSSVFLSNKDIRAYIAVSGDTVSSLATKFSVSADSIRWSNGLSGDTISPGKSLTIPPANVNGIVYKVQSGDTPASLATKYQSNEAKIIAYNDAEISGLALGEQIIIPDGQIVTPKASYATYVTGFAWGSGALYGFNGYDFGNCTWYVATQIAVPANWGNAATWAAGGRAAGWTVSSMPTVGAIAQTPYAAGGLGHVAIVDGVSDDGKQVLIRDMNGIAGFDRVGTAWESTSTYPNYITR